jgi:hypothetical protein
MSTIALRIQKRKARLSFENILKHQFINWRSARDRYIIQNDNVPLCERKDYNALDNLYKK